MLKKGARFAAVACAPIGSRRRAGKVLIVAVVGRAGAVEGILSARVTVDGTDATRQIVRMVSRSRFREQVRAIVLNGIAMAGLNVVDPLAIEKALGAATIVVTRDRPRPSKLVLALMRFRKQAGADVSGRISIVKRQARTRPFRAGGVFIQGMRGKEAAGLSSAAFDAVRMAHLIASGVSRGESRGRI